MGEIKFRAWTGLEMEYRVMAGFLGAFYVQGIDEKDNACLSPMNTKYSEQIPIMQFTGLKDKNGKDIYEGDIINDGENNGYISYVAETSEYIIDYWKKGDKESRGESLSSVGEVEVIGNVYENNELLTK